MKGAAPPGHLGPIPASGRDQPKRAYAISDAVVARAVLWAIATGMGQQAGNGYRATSEMAAQLVASGSPRSPELAAAMGVSRAFWFHCISTLLILLIVVDMIWKPGA